MENELYHYGRKGMKWYQNIFTKNKDKGSKTKTEEETPEQKKERILKSRSAKELYDNADLFTTQELNNAYTRLVLERNIKSLAPAEVGKGQQFVDKFTKSGDNAHKVFDTSSKLYNDAAKVYNTFFKGDNDPLPLIKDNDKKSNDQNNSNNKKSDKKADGKSQDKKSDKPDESKSNKTETHEGDVVGDGTSGKTAKATKPTTPEIIDADWNDVTVSDLSTSNSVSVGKEYVDYLLDYTDND